MSRTDTLRSVLTNLAAIFVGVVLAFAVENYRQDLNDRALGEQYLSGFRRDLTADLEMLQAQQQARQAQLRNAQTVLQFFEGRPIEPQGFFQAYWPVLYGLKTAPNRNAMNEVLSSGSLRLIRDARVRTDLINLYATYEKVARLEEHMARDFAMYLYDPTFSKIVIQVEGPWKDTPANRQAVAALLGERRIENGLRLVVINLEVSRGNGLLAELELARHQVEQLLQLIPAR
jgi:hypothetical protein